VKLSGRILASVAVAGALACAPAAAQAGTVNVEETHQPEEASLSTSIVHFAAAPGEANVVSIDRAEPEPGPGVEPPTTTVIVRDTGAPLTPGAGCSGIDAHTAACTLHGWHRQTQEFCGHDCYIQVPGSAWQDAERIELGDGNDAFTSSMGGKYEASWPTEVEGGSGDDTIATGSGEDTITPGPGNDSVRPGEGDNRVIADPQPDGNDRFEFLPGSTNEVDDSARTVPLHLADHILGAGSEADTISGPAQVIGGSADDEFIGSGEALDGRRGNDTLIGSSGDDEIEGGPGNDTIRGRGGDDKVYDSQGDDVIEGGAGDDYLRGAIGNDRISGGPGNDKLFGEAGDDRLNGGTGNDRLSGDEGRDTLRGGAGNDRLLSGFADDAQGANRGIDPAVDSVDCGPGKDTSLGNGWDKILDCEERRIAREVVLVETRAEPEEGISLIFFSAYATERWAITIGGKDVKPQSYGPIDPGHGDSEGSLTVQPRGRALKKLHRTGRVSVVVNLTWRLLDRPKVSETRQIRVLLEGPKKGAERR
jgi:hypothetical protein